MSFTGYKSRVTTIVLLLLGITVMVSTACSSVGLAQPPMTIEVLEVPARQTSAKTLVLDHLNLMGTATLEGYFRVQGGNNDIGFRVKDPNGRYLTDLGRVNGEHEFHFTIQQQGPYTLVFDNGFSLLTGKRVAFAYRIY